MLACSFLSTPLKTGDQVIGYTHYASRPKKLPLRAFHAAAADCQKVVETLCTENGFRVQWELNDSRPPLFAADTVRFNGQGEQGHETFLIEQIYPPYPGENQPRRGRECSHFCKTARKPYDAAVCACLIVFHHHFGKSFEVSSDGDDGDEGWVRGRECCQRVLGYGAEFTLNISPQMTRHGLAYASRWFNSTDGLVRTLCNGWELRKPRRGGFTYTVHQYPGDCADSFIASGNTIRDVIWKATEAFFQAEFKDAPYRDEFVAAMRAMPGEWSTLLVWSDKVQDVGDEAIAQRMRAFVPQQFSGVIAPSRT